MTATSTRVTYYYDALCGWCFGFAPAFDEFHQRHHDHLTFEVVSGGLFGDNPDKMPVGRVNEAAPHIKQGAYKAVEERTGVTFGAPFLEDLFGEGKLVLDSTYPAIAMAIVKDQAPEHEVLFAKILNDAVYKDGMDPTDVSGYAPYAEQIGLDPAHFQTNMTVPKYREAAQAEFERFRHSEANVFPTVVIERHGFTAVLAQGHATVDELEVRLANFLALAAGTDEERE